MQGVIGSGQLRATMRGRRLTAGAASPAMAHAACRTFYFSREILAHPAAHTRSRAPRVLTHESLPLHLQVARLFRAACCRYGSKEAGPLRLFHASGAAAVPVTSSQLEGEIPRGLAIEAPFLIPPESTGSPPLLCWKQESHTFPFLHGADAAAAVAAAAAADPVVSGGTRTTSSRIASAQALGSVALLPEYSSVAAADEAAVRACIDTTADLLLLQQQTSASVGDGGSVVHAFAATAPAEYHSPCRGILASPAAANSSMGTTTVGNRAGAALPRHSERDFTADACAVACHSCTPGPDFYPFVAAASTAAASTKVLLSAGAVSSPVASSKASPDARSAAASLAATAAVAPPSRATPLKAGPAAKLVLYQPPSVRQEHVFTAASDLLRPSATDASSHSTRRQHCAQLGASGRAVAADSAYVQITPSSNIFLAIQDTCTGDCKSDKAPRQLSGDAAGGSVSPHAAHLPQYVCFSSDPSSSSVGGGCRRCSSRIVPQRHRYSIRAAASEATAKEALCAPQHFQPLYPEAQTAAAAAAATERYFQTAERRHSRTRETRYHRRLCNQQQLQQTITSPGLLLHPFDCSLCTRSCRPASFAKFASKSVHVESSLCTASSTAASAGQVFLPPVLIKQTPPAAATAICFSAAARAVATSEAAAAAPAAAAGSVAVAAAPPVATDASSAAAVPWSCSSVRTCIFFALRAALRRSRHAQQQRHEQPEVLSQQLLYRVLPLQLKRLLRQVNGQQPLKAKMVPPLVPVLADQQQQHSTSAFNPRVTSCGPPHQLQQKTCGPLYRQGSLASIDLQQWQKQIRVALSIPLHQSHCEFRRQEDEAHQKQQDAQGETWQQQTPVRPSGLQESHSQQHVSRGRQQRSCKKLLQTVLRAKQRPNRPLPQHLLSLLCRRDRGGKMKTKLRREERRRRRAQLEKLRGEKQQRKQTNKHQQQSAAAAASVQRK